MHCVHPDHFQMIVAVSVQASDLSLVGQQAERERKTEVKQLDGEREDVTGLAAEPQSATVVQMAPT